MTTLNLNGSENGLTIRDRRGNHLVFERWPDGNILSWSTDENGNETHSTALTVDDRLRIIAFLSRGLS